MAYFSFNNVEIAGISAAVPQNVVEVENLSSTFGKSTVKKITKRTGVKRYHKALEQQTASDLGYSAAENLIDKLNFDKSEIDCLIFVSLSHDYIRPATSYVLQKRLGLKTDCAVFDVGLGCSGFVYGLQIACSMMQTSNIDKTLLIVSESVSKLAWPNDQSTSMLLGDAGAAIMLAKKEDAEQINGLTRADGDKYKSIIVPGGAFRNRDLSREPYIGEDGIERTNYHFDMNGTDVFSFAINEVPIAIRDFMVNFNSEIEAYDFFSFHQANAFIEKQLIKAFNISMDRVVTSISEYGNTSGPSIPTSLCNYFGDREMGVKKILMCGFGVGLSWGVTSITANTNNFFPIIETNEWYNDAI